MASCARYWPVIADADAATLTFARNRQGKPYLTPWANGPDLQFSLSHSGDYCMLALRLDHTIGIDVEEMRDLPQAIDIAESYFTPSGKQSFGGLAGNGPAGDIFCLVDAQGGCGQSVGH